VALALIELKNISLQFGEEVILQNVNFSIFEKENFTLIGPSGTGEKRFDENDGRFDSTHFGTGADCR
jgi:ABC-type uncharacterized transport system YnjBCD ATPase subunit